MVVSKSPKDRVVGPLPNGLFYGLQMDVPNYLLTGMILQVGCPVGKVIGSVGYFTPNICLIDQKSLGCPRRLVK